MKEFSFCRFVADFFAFFRGFVALLDELFRAGGRGVFLEMKGACTR